MITENKEQVFHFLAGGGEMGALTRKHDWSATPVGAPHTWPQSLRTVVSIILHSDFPMFLWWGEDMIQFYNDAYRPSLGDNGKHPIALGQKGKECWPEIWQIIYPLIQQVQQTGKSFFTEDALVPIFRNGKIEDVYWTFSYSPVIGETGTIDGILVVCHETTGKVETFRQLEESQHELLQSSNRLEENRSRVHSLVDSAPFPIAMYEGREMRIVLANQAIVDVWGKGDKWIENTYYGLLPELESQQIYPILDGVYTSGKPYHARNQLVVLEMNGSLTPFYFNYSFTPLLDSEGKVYGVLNTAADVTDLNVAKQRVEQSGANFRAMILQAPVAMCILLGPDHVVEIANDLMIELWGKPVEGVLNKPVFEGLPEAREQGLEQLISDVYRTGIPVTASERPVELVRKGKTDIVFQNFVYQPYRDADGKILGVLAITVDVTDQVLARRKIEEIVAERTRELEASNRDLQKSNAELAQFAYIASHDLQEPLRKIRIFSQMASASLGDHLKADTQNYLNKIDVSSRRMQALIHDVLAFSELNKQGDLFQLVDLNEILEDVKSDFEITIDQKKATITSASLPVIEAIPLQMTQLMGNLVSNAIKFTKLGARPVLMITLTTPTAEDLQRLGLATDRAYYNIRFSDNGIGFSEAFSEQIFNIFQRLHRKSEFEGTGIGLAICRKIVSNHHGTIDAHGSSEQGAVFNVILPVKQNR